MSEPLYISSLPWTAEHGPALVIYCSDNRFGAQTEEFLQDHLEIPQVDRFVVPGSAAWLVLREGTLREYDVARKGLNFLVEHHRITRIVLVAHHDCGFYRACLSPDTSEAERRAVQEMDLQEAARVLSAWFAGISVESYYANVVDGEVVFERVEDIK
jgi:carbonic anhydrase